MSVIALQLRNNLKGTVWSVEDFQVFDIGSGDMALEEPAWASVAQADGFTRSSRGLLSILKFCTFGKQLKKVDEIV